MHSLQLNLQIYIIIQYSTAYNYICMYICVCIYTKTYTCTYTYTYIHTHHMYLKTCYFYVLLLFYVQTLTLWAPNCLPTMMSNASRELCDWQLNCIFCLKFIYLTLARSPSIHKHIIIQLPLFKFWLNKKWIWFSYNNICSICSAFRDVKFITCTAVPYLQLCSSRYAAK